MLISLLILTVFLVCVQPSTSTQEVLCSCPNGPLCETGPWNVTDSEDDTTFYLSICTPLEDADCNGSWVCSVDINGTANGYGLIKRWSANSLIITDNERVAQVLLTCNDTTELQLIHHNVDSLTLSLSGDLFCKNNSFSFLSNDSSSSTVVSPSTTSIVLLPESIGSFSSSSHNMSSTEMMPNMSSTEMMPNVSSTEMMPNVSSTKMMPDVSSTKMMPNVSSTEMMPNMSSTKVMPNMSSTKVMLNISTPKVIPSSTQMVPTNTMIIPNMSSTITATILPISTSSFSTGATSTPTSQSSSSLSTTDKILITAFVSIPLTALLTVVIVLAAIFCFKKKGKNRSTYVRLAPTVFFDDDDS